MYRPRAAPFHRAKDWGRPKHLKFVFQRLLYRQAIKDGARVATMPGMTMEMFTEGGMSADFNIIKKNISEMGSVLRRKRIVNVKSDTGTNVTFEVNWRDWKYDDNGICNRPRMLTNLPAGKIFTMPREGTMNGTIVIDGSWDSTLVDEPVVLQIENGLVVDVKGGTAAAQIRQTFGEAAKRLKAKDQETSGPSQNSASA